MRVLHVIAGLATTTGGPAVSVTSSVRALEAQGVFCTIATTDLGGVAGTRRRLGSHDLPEDSRELRLSVGRACPPRRLAFSPELWRALPSLAAEHDVLHIHSLFLFPQFAAYRAAAAARKPFVVAPRGALDTWHRQTGKTRKRLTDLVWQGRMLNTAAGLHLTSDAELRMVSDIAPRVPRFVVPNVVNTSFWQAPGDPGGFRARYVRGTREPIVAFIGRITPKKRVDILVDAVARLSDRGVTLVIAGADDSGLRPHLDRQIEALGVRDRVVFTGHLDPTEARSLLKAASAWVLPSETENFGMAVVEAMAAGVPVIISSGVGLAPDAAKADAAIVLGSLSAGEVCARLEEVLQSPELRRSIREGGASFAARFEGEEVARGLATMYEAVVRSSVSGIGGGVSTRGLTS